MLSGAHVRRVWPASILAVLLAACGTDTTEPQSSGRAETSAAEPSSTPTKSQPSKDKEPAAEVPAILDFSATTVAGDEFEGASLAGKPAVLWFWAPWCPTCRGQIAGVSGLANEYGDDVGFVGVGSLDEAPAIEGFANDVPADFPHLLDPEGEVWQHFGIVEQSVYVVLEADGEVVSEGYLDDDALEDLVSDLAG